MVSMTCRCASIKMTIGGTSMNTAAAIATPALARPADAACCTTVGRVFRDSWNTSVPP